MSKPPCEGLLPVTAGDCTLSEGDARPLHVIAPFKGQEAAVSDALGMKWPAPNRSASKAGAQLIWFARGQALLIGAEPPKIKGAAVTDVSDGWAVVSLQGAGAEDVLARLVPVDLRRATFKRGHTLRSQVQHMSASITRTGADSFMIMVFRSMAATLVHDLKIAMEAVALRR